MSIVGWKCGTCGTVYPGKSAECDACGPGTVLPFNTRTGARISEPEIASLIAEEERRIRAEKEEERKEEEKEESERKIRARKMEEYIERFDARMAKWKKAHRTTSVPSTVPPSVPTPIPPSPTLPPPSPPSRDFSLARLVGFILFVVVCIVVMFNGLKGSSNPPVAPKTMTASEMAQRMIVAAMAPSDNKEFEEIRDKLLAMKTGRNPADPKRIKSGAKLNQAGMKAMKNRKYWTASERFSDAVVEDPENERYIRNLGMAWEKRGDPPKAEEWYLMAVVKAPGSLETWRDFGLLKVRRGDQQGAIGCFVAMGRISKNYEPFIALKRRKDLTDKERNAIEAAIEELVKQGVFWR